MKYNNNIEVILVSKLLPSHSGRKELVNWLTTTLQFAIDRQHAGIKKMFLSILKDTPAIYLS